MLNCVALDKVFRALADPTRRFMVECLCEGETSVSQLAEPLPMNLNSIMQHLRVLEESGLIHTEKVGRIRTCRIEPQVLRLLDQWMTPRRRLWERAPCAGYLNSNAPPPARAEALRRGGSGQSGPRR
jgi:DNA-binding transcriptional ArsR family regulator